MVDKIEFLTRREAADRLHLTPERVRQLDGDLRPVSTAGGRARLYPVGRIEHLAGLRDARGHR